MIFGAFSDEFKGPIKLVQNFLICYGTKNFKNN